MRWALPLLVVCVAVATSWSILGNFFERDDFGDLFELANSGPREWLVAPAAGHLYLVRNSIYYVNFLAFRMNAVGYFTGVLVTHVIAVLLLFALIRRVTESQRLAAFGAILFALSGANAGTLGWYAVYGHVLATVFTLLALLALVPRASDTGPPSLGATSVAAFCMLAASQCFGTATAVALALPVLAVVLRPAILRRPSLLLVLCIVPVLVVVAMVLMYGEQTRLNPNPELWRFFLVCATYVGPVASMFLHLFTLGVVTLLVGAAYPLGHYPDGVAVAVTVIFVVAVGWGLIASGPRARTVMIVCLGVALISYAAVAGPRAIPFGIMRPKDLLRAYAAATRYHYLAQAALSVVVCLVLAAIAARVQIGETAKTALLGVFAAAATASNLLLGPAMNHYDDVRAEVTRARERIRAGVEAAPSASTACIPNERMALSTGFPGLVGVFVLYHVDDQMDGHHVRFVADAEPGAGVVGRARALLVSRDACPDR